MLRKSSFKNQAAVIVDFGPDYQYPLEYGSNIETKYIKFTTQDAHNFVPGSFVTINGLYKAQLKAGPVTSIGSIKDATILGVSSPTSFTVLLPESYTDSNTSQNSFRFLNVNYYINSSGIGSKTTWSGAFLNTNGWDLYKVNQQVHAYSSDGNLGAYKVSYGDTV